jgi:chitodextrinase
MAAGVLTLALVVVAAAPAKKPPTSNSVIYTTPADVTPPSPPPTLSATAVYPTRVTLAWTSSIDDASSQVWYTLSGDGVARDESAFGNSNLVQDLAPGSAHTFAVAVRDATGNAARSNVLTATTTDTTAPSAPANLRLGPQSGGCEAWLNWDASTDETDARSLIQYDVYVNGVRTPDGVIGHTSIVSYARAVGIVAFVVTAVDTSGNVSAASNEVPFDALPC